MATSEFVGPRGMEEVTAAEMAGVKEKEGKPTAVKIASILMYVMAGLFVFAVLGGKSGAVFFILLAVYLAHGLSSLKSSARTGAIVFACFGSLVNIAAYSSSRFNGHLTLFDVVLYAVLLGLLCSPSAGRANWVKKGRS